MSNITQISYSEDDHRPPSNLITLAAKRPGPPRIVVVAVAALVARGPGGAVGTVLPARLASAGCEGQAIPILVVAVFASVAGGPGGAPSAILPIRLDSAGSEPPTVPKLCNSYHWSWWRWFTVCGINDGRETAAWTGI